MEEGKHHGKGVIARLAGCSGRDAAQALIGCDIGVCRDQLPAVESGEYYWSDLEGLEVRNLQGDLLGIVDHLMETGANDVLVVRGERERLIPFVQGPVVIAVDLEGHQIQVDWDKDF